MEALQNEASVVIVPLALELSSGPIRLGINIHKVLKVAECSECGQRLPNQFAPFVGVFETDEKPVPVLDLRLVLDPGAPPRSNEASQGDHRRIIICNLQGAMVGMIVDRTSKIEQFRSDEVLPPPTALLHGKPNYFNAVIKTGDRYTYLLDVENILMQNGIKLHEEETKSPRSARFAGKRILLVEDSPFFQKRCATIFRNQGAEVDATDNGRDGLRLLGESKAAYDLIFTDIEMPIMNGIQMAIEIKRIYGETAPPVLFNSSISNPSLIEELKQKKLGDYIVKLDEKLILEKAEQIFKPN